MSDRITITGLVATQPRHIVTSEGLPITSFRLASTQRRFDTSAEKGIDGETNWYIVTAFRQFATHTAESVNKGDRILVGGKLRIREWASGKRTGTNIEVEAEALGHDLTWAQGYSSVRPERRSRPSPKKWSSRVQRSSSGATTKLQAHLSKGKTS